MHGRARENGKGLGPEGERKVKKNTRKAGARPPRVQEGIA